MPNATAAAHGVAFLVTRRWHCPNCGKEDVTHEPKPHSRFHVCPGLGGLTAPMLPHGTKAKVEALEREDYVKDEIVQTNSSGRPIASVVTTRDTGQDTIVFAPTATASLKGR